MGRTARARRAATVAGRLAVLLGVAGAVHFIRPRTYDPIVPEPLPRRTTTLLSGAAELAVGLGLALPRTRKASGWAAAALFAAVFPANVKMARDLLDDPRSSRVTRLAAVLRLPLQVPLVLWSVRVGRHAR